MDEGNTNLLTEFTTKESLYHDYVIVGMSTRDIAHKYESSQTNVRRLLAHYNIPARKPGTQTEYFKQKMRPIYDSFRISNKKYHEKTCDWCGNSFSIDYTTKNNMYCSKECRHNAAMERRVTMSCEQCGKNIEWRPYKVRFCKSCRSKFMSTSQIDRVATTCGYCGASINVIPSVYAKNTYCYCNAECMAKHYALIYTGENSPTWTGGKRHYSGGWFNARKEARKRDNYTCARCGVRESEYGQELSVHHIKKYRDFENKNEANELSNLISLCEPCHRFIHSKKNTDRLFIQ